MSCKSKAIVYPFDVEFSPILRHRNILSNYEIVGLVSPSGWGYNGKDVKEIDGGPKTEFVVRDVFNVILKECDTVIFSSSYHTVDKDHQIYPQINAAIKANKNIVICLDIEEYKINEIQKKCAENKLKFEYTGLMNYARPQIIHNNKLAKINTPVVFILGLSERTNKFDLQLSLRDKLEQKGYKVGHIGSRNHCSILGFTSFPSFMYSNEYTEEEKIFMFNAFVKSIELNETPDIILIGIPGGIMKFSDTYPGYFGINAYRISQAVSPDVSILSVLYEEYELEFFNQLFLTVKYKLGFELDCFNLANVRFDWGYSKQKEEMFFTTVDWDYIDKKKAKYSDLKIPVFHGYCENDINKLVNLIISKLSTESEVTYF